MAQWDSGRIMDCRALQADKWQSSKSVRSLQLQQLRGARQHVCSIQISIKNLGLCREIHADLMSAHCPTNRFGAPRRSAQQAQQHSTPVVLLLCANLPSSAPIISYIL